jgi:hypothetical protein
MVDISDVPASDRRPDENGPVSSPLPETNNLENFNLEDSMRRPV